MAALLLRARHGARCWHEGQLFRAAAAHASASLLLLLPLHRGSLVCQHTGICCGLLASHTPCTYFDLLSGLHLTLPGAVCTVWHAQEFTAVSVWRPTYTGVLTLLAACKELP